MGLRIPAGQRQTCWLFTSMADDLNSRLAWTNPASVRSGQDKARVGLELGASELQVHRSAMLPPASINFANKASRLVSVKVKVLLQANSLLICLYPPFGDWLCPGSTKLEGLCVLFCEMWSLSSCWLTVELPSCPLTTAWASLVLMLSLSSSSSSLSIWVAADCFLTHWGGFVIGAKLISCWICTVFPCFHILWKLHNFWTICKIL